MGSFSYKFADLVDIPALEKMLADLYKAAHIPSAIIDLDGNFLTGAGWQRICLDFHRQNSESERACIESDIYIRDTLRAGEPYAIYECPHGLIDSCCPVIVDGRHLANVFTGQMLHTPLTDEICNRFRSQARKFGFNEDEYLKALSEVPVFPIEKHESILKFLSNLAGQIAQMGLAKLKTLEKSKIIQENEEKLRVLIETTDTGYVTIDQQGFVLDANREYVRITGNRQFADIIGRNVIEWTAEYDIERNRSEVEKCFREGQVRNLELDYVHPDGSIVPIEINATIIVQGGETSILSMIRDISERKQAEKLLRENEALYRSLFNNKHTVMLLVDPETSAIIEANPAACSFYGYEHRELTRMTVSDLDTLSLAEIKAEMAMGQQKERQHFIFQHRLADGAIRDVEIYSEPVLVKGRQLLYSIIHDISEKKEADRALVESEARLQAFLDNANTAIFLKDITFKYLLINRHYGKLVQADPQGIIGREDYDVLPREIADLFRSQDLEVLKQNRALEFQETITLPGGEQTFITSKFPLYDPAGKIYAVGGVCIDITERRRAEEALIKREGQLVESQIVARLGSWDLDLDSQELEWSEQMYRLFDKDPKKFTPSFAEFARLVHLDDFTTMQTGFNNALASDASPYHVKVRIINDSGREWLMEVFGKVNRDAGGKATGIFGTAQDVTDHLRMEEALARANEEWHYAMDFFEDAIYLIDMNDKLVRANKKFYQLTGLTPEQAIGHDINLIIHPQGEEVPCPVCAARIARKDATIKMEPDHPDNPTGRPIEVMVKMIRDSAGSPIGVLMGIRDLSHHQEIENILRQGKEEWEQTFDAMGDIITIQNKDMKIIRANKAAHDFFEVKPGGLNGQHCYEIFRGEDKPCAQCPELETIVDFCAHAGTIKHEKLGKTFHVSSSPMLDGKGELKYLVHIAKDITEQKKLEEELFQSHKMEAIGTLAGGIAHDFNNILSAILGYSELSLMELPADSPSRNHVEQIQLAGDRAKDLVKQILSFSRKSRQQLEAFEPSTIIKEALKLMRASLPTTIAIKIEIDSACGRIMADPTNLHQILVNLCTNALHAIENEKGEIRIKLDRQVLTSEETGGQLAVKPGPFVVLTVSDNGCGMDEEIVPRIFEPYFTTKEQGKGTGMGLAVVHGIVQSYGGMIKVTSKPGRGTTFTLYFPAIENGADNKIEGGPGLSQSLPRGDERIMLVDDEEAIVKMEKIFLAGLGYDVSTMGSAVEALAEFRGNPGGFDLILTDQTMPTMTGVDLTKEILKINPDVPIILCTGYSSMITEAETKKIGIKRFVKKPIDVKDLALMVRQVLDDE